MSGAELMAVIGFGVMLFGAMLTLWRYVESRIEKETKEAKREAEVAQTLAATVAANLAKHELHVAETYITKQGMREATESIMTAIHGVKAAVDHMTMRVDRIVENQSKPVRRRANED